jgi:hypothetical protein
VTSIRNPDLFVQISGHETIGLPELILSRNRVVPVIKCPMFGSFLNSDHLYTGPSSSIRMVFFWTKFSSGSRMVTTMQRAGPYHFRTQSDHSKNGLVRYSDGHCIYENCGPGQKKWRGLSIIWDYIRTYCIPLIKIVIYVCAILSYDYCIPGFCGILMVETVQISRQGKDKKVLF